MIRMPGSGGVLDQLAKAIEDHSGLAREAKDEALKFVDKVKPLVKAGKSSHTLLNLATCLETK